MKKLQEYSDQDLSPSIATAIKRMEKLPLPYTGNKKKLAMRIHDALIENKVEFNSVLDAFSGSATVSYLFKLMGKKVISNDLLTSSYLTSVAFVENPGIKITEEEQEFLLYNQNKNKGTFVEDNYLGEEFRKPGQTCRYNKFTLKECRHLDNFRANIDELCGLYQQSIGLASNAAVIMRLPFGQVDQSTKVLTHRNKQKNKYGKDSDNHDRRIGIYYDEDLNLNFNKWFPKYVSDFISGVQTTTGTLEKYKRASFLTNIQQHVLRDCMVQGRLHCGQSLAELDIRLKHQKNQLKGSWSNNGSTEMDFFTRAGTSDVEGLPGQGLKWFNFSGLNTNGSCLSTNMDVINLLNSGLCDSIDAAYFDPPYGSSSSDYATIYRFLEEYIYSKPIEELEHIKNSKRFVSKKNYESNYREMLSAGARIPIWLFSYNDTSWKSVEYITSIISEFKNDVKTVVLDENYRYLYRNRQGRDKLAREVLIIAK